MKKLIFGTSNPAKILQVQGALKPLGITVSGLPESACAIEIIEDGKTAQENARKKALGYAKVIGEPVFSMDNALFLEGLSPDEQPGIHVRRINSVSDRPSDQELLSHYSSLVDRLGGRISGRWEFGLCYARPNGGVYERTIVSPRIFVSIPCKNIDPGYPLESIQIDPDSGKYISEMTQDEKDVFWQKTIGKGLAEFMSSIKE